AQAHAAQALRFARGRARRHPRGAGERARLSAEGRARPVRPPQQDGALSMANAVRDASLNGRHSPHLRDLVVISELWGAGKSSAMNVFEDAGYFCVDNLPAEMIRSLADLFMHEGSKVELAAVVCDSRGGEYLASLAGVIDRLAAARVVHRVVFLEADEE